MRDHPLYLGRFQQGEEVPLTLACRTAAGVPEDPADDPVVTVYRDDAGTLALVQTVELAACNRGAATGHFRRPLFLGITYSTTGRYLVIFRWATAGGVARSVTGSFTVLPGGDGDGHVIAQCFVARPDANHLIAQTDSGRVVRGRNPR